MNTTRIALGCWLVLALTGLSFSEPKSRFPSGNEAAARMTVPPGFHVKCFASEPDVLNPIGIDFDHRGRVYVLECLQYPRKAKGPRGADRIRVYEDTDGDHVADKVTTFAEGLNLATGIAYGFGGVFVGQAPELLFLQDTDGDGKADKRTVLLDGWGLHDTHELLNSFIWGPDGWLYGCHGVFTHSRVGRPGTPANQRVPINAGIWRYHPQTRRFEVFAEGTSNPWGFDFDEHGAGFLTCCVIPHLFHMSPGGLYIRQAGQNFNPYAYGQIREICDHVHYFGSHSHIGNKDPRRFAVGGGHAHAGCLIYQGGAFPKEWHGRIFMHNLHGARINTDILKKNGSTYVGSHGPDFLVANDPNFRAIQLRTGPDGSIYMIDWYDPQICHNTDPAIWDRDHGRIYKVIYNPNKLRPARAVPNLSKLTSSELVQLLNHRNSWWWRKALLILQERGDRSVTGELERLVFSASDPSLRLRALWALNNVGGFDEEIGRRLLQSDDAWLRAWSVRLLAQLYHRLDGATWADLETLATNEDNPIVLLQLASACQKWHRTGHDTTGISRRLSLHSEVLNDPALPLMIWLAMEPNVPTKPKETLSWLATAVNREPIPSLLRSYILPRVVRRLATGADRSRLAEILRFLEDLRSAEARIAGLDGMLEALRGRRVEPPKCWATGEVNLADIKNQGLIWRVHRLGVHFGDQAAVTAMEQVAVDSHGPTPQRVQAIRDLALARLPSSAGRLASLVASSQPGEIRKEALRALAAFDDPRIGQKVLDQWQQMPESLRREVITLLTGRKSWAASLVTAVEEGRVDRRQLTENHIRRILAFQDSRLASRVESVWGKVRNQTPEKVTRLMARFRHQLATLPADRHRGKAVFEKHCMVCHKLDGQGHTVGPDLTGANRRDVEYLLVNILDPNRVVGRDYYTATVLDLDGRLHTGLIVENTPQRVTLKGENDKLTTIARDDIDQMRIDEKSLMPEGLPETMTEQHFRDLIAYLLEDPYLNLGVVAGPFKMALAAPGPIETADDPLTAEGVTWRPFHRGPAGRLDMGQLGVLGPPTDSTAYVIVHVRSPRRLKTYLNVAADDGVRVWLNGREIHHRPFAHRPERIPVELEEGVNRFMFKVHNIYGPSLLEARISDPERVLELVPPLPVRPSTDSRK